MIVGVRIGEMCYIYRICHNVRIRMCFVLFHVPVIDPLGQAST